MRRVARVLVVVVALGAFVALAACKPKAGGTCKKEDARVCADPSTLLHCEGGKYVALACGGGCKNDDCVWAEAKDDEECRVGGRAFPVCSSDGKRRLECIQLRHPVLMQEICQGSRGCHREGADVVCDKPRAGEPCTAPPAAACNEQEHQLLRCTNGTWTVERPCRWQCFEQLSLPPVCDVSKSAEGDPCWSEEEGRVVCGVDETVMLRCTHGRYVHSDSCPAGKKCWNGHERTKADVLEHDGANVVVPENPVCR